MRFIPAARFAFVVVARRYFAGWLTLPQEENFASYIFMGSLTQVFVYLGMSVCGCLCESEWVQVRGSAMCVAVGAGLDCIESAGRARSQNP